MWALGGEHSWEHQAEEIGLFSQHQSQLKGEGGTREGQKRIFLLDLEEGGAGLEAETSRKKPQN